MKTPRFENVTYSLLDLSTHRSGLIRDIAMDSFTDDELTAWIPGSRLLSKPGATFAYSNYGLAILGKVLADRAGKPFEELMASRIFGPLGLKDTIFDPDETEKKKLALGTFNGAVVPYVELKAFRSASGIKSSPKDLLRFMQAQLGMVHSSLDSTIESTHHQVVDGGTPMALGFFIKQSPAGPILWHNGYVFGHTSFFGLRLSDKKGVVLLENSEHSINDIGFHMLDESFPILDWETTIVLPGQTLDKFCGRYMFDKKYLWTVVREGDGLAAQSAGQNPISLLPQDQTTFINAAAQIRIHFDIDKKGEATGLEYGDSKGLRIK
jgi:CubicO group peptidase (beta-lactamase class C family)